MCPLRKKVRMKETEKVIKRSKMLSNSNRRSQKRKATYQVAGPENHFNNKRLKKKERGKNVILSKVARSEMKKTN